jgi:hypothetical protein
MEGLWEITTKTYEPNTVIPILSELDTRLVTVSFMVSICAISSRAAGRGRSAGQVGWAVAHQAGNYCTGGVLPSLKTGEDNIENPKESMLNPISAQRGLVVGGEKSELNVLIRKLRFDCTGVMASKMLSFIYRLGVIRHVPSATLGSTHIEYIYNRVQD